MGKQPADIVKKLVESFRQYGGINHLDQANLPSREAVVAITCNLLRLMFPGFYNDEIHSNDVVAFTTQWVDTIKQGLLRELHKSLIYRPVAPGAAASR